MNTSDYLHTLWSNAPLSWAIIRAVECQLLSQQQFRSPVLEVGCGDGLVTKTFFQNRKYAVDLGIDLDIQELSRAAKTDVYKNLEKIDICQNNIPARSFNTIFANGVLEHISQLDKALLQISRILKKDGIFITTSPTNNYAKLLFYSQFFSKMGFKNAARVYENMINKKFHHVHLYDHLQWKNRLKAAGLQLRDYTYYNNTLLTSIHDLALPLSLFTKTLKHSTDQMALFTSIRKILLKPLIPFMQRALSLQYPKDGHTHASILLVAKKV